MKIKYRKALFHRSLLFKLGLGNHLLKNRYGTRILEFHGIDQKGTTKFNSRFISAANFEELIIYFKKNYNLISIEDFYNEKFKQGMMNIALTFDDGYQNNFKYAVPILEKHQVPASFYITTIHEKYDFLWPDFLDLVSFFTTKKEVVFHGRIFKKNAKNEFKANQLSLKNYCKDLSFEKIELLFDLFQEDWNLIKLKPLDDYWKLMNKEAIKKIAENPLFTIGAHSYSHSNLAVIPLEEAKAEIDKNKNILEKEYLIPVNEFALPFGAYTAEVLNYCKQVGYSKILLTNYLFEEDQHEPAALERFIINPHISKEHQIACLLKESYFLEE